MFVKKIVKHRKECFISLFVYLVRRSFVILFMLVFIQDEPVGFPITYISAEDDDMGSNALVYYYIVDKWSDGGSGDDLFVLDANSGE